MPPIAIPYVLPAVGEGILWGAGALGTGLAALGIIENKDAIRNGLSDFGNYVSSGILNGISNISQAMSPNHAVQNPSIDLNTGRYVAVPDATRVLAPYPNALLPQVLQTAGTPATGTPKTKKTRRTTTKRAAASSPQNNNDPNKRSLIRRSVEWVKRNPKKSLAIGAVSFYPTREYIAKPIFNYAGPVVGNAVSYITTGEVPFNIPTVVRDSADLWYSGGVGIVKDPNLTRLGYSTDYLLTDATIQTEKPVSVDTITAIPRDSVPITPVNTFNWSEAQ